MVLVSDNAAANRAGSALLVVDLDGTLLKGDLLHECIAAACKRSPWTFLRAIAALSRGRAAVKKRFAATHAIDPATLPYRAEVLEVIAAQRSQGATVVLATAADQSLARAIAAELKLFDHVLASDGTSNLKGVAKLGAITAYCEANGFQRFDYIGDSHADLPIWTHAEHAYAVNPSRGLALALRRHRQQFTPLGQSPSIFRTYLRALRAPQWAKNLLVFIPAITSHRLFETPVLVATLLAFVCFCLCSSGIYILNDILDIQSDRRHPRKKTRPFAAGELSILQGLGMAAVCLCVGLAASLLLRQPAFTLLLTCYVLSTSAYSLAIKRVVMLDVIMLACLYTLRVLSGGVAAVIPVSEWLMAFSLFIFLSLAVAKRYAELARLAGSGERIADGRGYQVGDLNLVQSMGTACGFLAVLVLVLYIQSDQMKRLYSGSWALWLLCPLLAYWIGRVWILAHRGELGEDPVVFSIRDPVSIALAALAGLLILAGAAAG